MATVFTQTRPSAAMNSPWLSTSTKPPSTATLRPPAVLSPRKIRFAPLPDPRRSVLITDDGQELPIPNGEDATTISSSSSPSPAVLLAEPQAQETSSLSSFGSSSKRASDSTDPSSTSGSTTPASMTNTTNSEASSEPNSPASTPLILPPSLPPLFKAVNTPTLPAATPIQPPSNPRWQKSKGISFFRAFKRGSGSSSSSSISSSNTLTPVNSNDPGPAPSSSRKGITTEEILTLGTINLFRASSRESGDGWNLTRWASAGSPGPSSTGPARNFGVPLSRTQSTQSTQSYKSKTPSLLSGLRSSATPSSKPKKKPTGPVRKGTRMLNGRVYGSKRDPNANPFANARDEEPSFVEWGYGGMGSVGGARSAGVTGAGWEKLGVAAADDDLEDATGTAWVRKRREARERKAREEQEAKEKAEKAEAESPETIHEEKTLNETTSDGESDQTPAAVSNSSFPTPTASSADLTLSSSPKPLSPTLSRIDSSPAPNTSNSLQSPSRELASPVTDDDHVFKTMSIPPRPTRRTRSASSATFTHAVVEVDATPELAKLDSGSESSETESESERGSDSESDSDSDADGEEEEQRRKMVIGAGMEKVSWHRTEVEEHA